MEEWKAAYDEDYDWESIEPEGTCMVVRPAACACGDGGEAAWGTSTDPHHSSTRGSHSPLRPSFLHTLPSSYRIPTHLLPLRSLTLTHGFPPPYS
ncbi:hypothetical protein Pcinc_013542 [Petrolisthes cinctipes]|uniref:Uncharacterized protein n=1 Tax=Petrolisthes cinctipes TaxID=88211 RepID=A0AAE1FWT3_PETCI|nr:hypothetical protein Pcinc_013542 [Petrolisthes cinctipes]